MAVGVVMFVNNKIIKLFLRMKKYCSQSIRRAKTDKIDSVPCNHLKNLFYNFLCYKLHSRFVWMQPIGIKHFQMRTNCFTVNQLYIFVFFTTRNNAFLYISHFFYSRIVFCRWSQPTSWRVPAADPPPVDCHRCRRLSWR